MCLRTTWARTASYKCNWYALPPELHTTTQNFARDAKQKQSLQFTQNINVMGIEIIEDNCQFKTDAVVGTLFGYIYRGGQTKQLDLNMP